MRRTSRPRKAAAGKARAAKISITVDEGVLRDVRAEARRAGRTLSAQVTDALARDVRRRRLEALVEAYEAEHGAIGEDDLEVVRATWRA